ncbi:MAG: tetratricopeptide repeat protein, partial [Chitinophagaceae bacterium]
GQWMAGKANGNGTKIFNGGDKYTGEWKDDKINGEGVYTWKNGDTYTGSFKADMMSGKGKKVYQDGIIYEGEWSSGVYVGTGVLSWPNKNKYEGKFVAGIPSGNGKFYRNNKLFFEGYFDGTSTYSTAKNWLLKDGTYARRTIYTDGSFFEIWYPDNSVFFGSIKDPGYNGSIADIQPNEGFMLSAGGKVVVGKWENKIIKVPTYTFTLKMSDAVPDYVKGRALLAYKKNADALIAFNKAISQNIKEDSVYLFRGTTYAGLNKHDSALLDLNTLLKKQPKSKEGLTWRAKVFAAKKDTAAALADYNTYINFYSKDSMGYWQRGIMHHNKKDYAKAIADYTKVLEFSKGANDNVYYYRGVCYELINKNTEACADFEKAKKVGNKSAEAKIKKLCVSPG